MAHFQQLKFVEIIAKNFPDFFNSKKILEVGSWNANGSIRDNFKECNYIGVDVTQGPGVDVVCPGEKIQYANDSFDLVISCECFEHNPNWKETFLNMHRMLKNGGMFILTCATLGRGEHGTSRRSPDASLTVLNGQIDYYKNISKKDLYELNLDELFDVFKVYYNIYSADLYFIGIKNSTIKPNINLNKLDNLVKTIKTNKKTSILYFIIRSISFWIKFAIAKAIGEKKYHDLKYNYRKRRKK
jgi:SAM-dependent methyltransferase